MEKFFITISLILWGSILACPLNKPALAQSAFERYESLRYKDPAKMKTSKNDEEVAVEDSFQAHQIVKKVEKQGGECSDDYKTNGSYQYHRGCYCRTQEYPEIASMLWEYGMKFEAKGIQEMGTGVVQITPSERNTMYYLCGIDLTWDTRRKKMYRNREECEYQVNKAVGEIAGRVPVLASKALAVCAKEDEPIEPEPATQE